MAEEEYLRILTISAFFYVRILVYLFVQLRIYLFNILRKLQGM